MSYPFRVTVSKSVEEVVSAADRIVKKITLRPILPPSAMNELLVKSLEERGWQETATPGVYEKLGPEGERETFDLETMTMTTIVETASTISKTETVEARGDMDFETRGISVEEAQERLRRKTEQELEQRIRISDEERDRRRRELERDAADRLQGGEGERTREWNDIERQVYADALKKKATELGKVVDIKEGESDGNYNLTITITERNLGLLNNPRPARPGYRGSDAPRERDFRRGMGVREEREEREERMDPWSPSSPGRIPPGRRLRNETERNGGYPLSAEASERVRRSQRERMERERHERLESEVKRHPRGALDPRRRGDSRDVHGPVAPGRRVERPYGRSEPERGERFGRGRMGFRPAPISFTDVARALIADDEDFVYDVAVRLKVLVPEVKHKRWFVGEVAAALEARFDTPEAASRRLLGS